MFTRTTHHFATALVVAALAAPGCGKPKGETTPPDATPPADNGPPVAAKPTRVYQDPPPPTEPRDVQFPDLQKITTKNGLEIYVVENHEVPLITAQLVIKAGTMDDEQLAEMTASMLGEGTKTRAKAKIDQEIEFVGGSLGAGAGIHDTSVFSQVLKRDIKLALTLMADEVMNPAFPADALTKLKDKAKTGLKAMKSNSDVLADHLFQMAAYPAGHPYGRPIPSEAQIDAVTVDAVKKFHDTFYRSNNAYLILSGDITVPEAEKLGNEVFGKWKPIEGNAPINPLNGFKSYKHPPKLIVHLVNRPGSAQSDIRVGNLALARKNPEWIKLDLASDILGGGSTGRLFLDVREEKGLTYGIYTKMEPGVAPGTWRIWTKTKTATTGEMLKAIFGHIKKMRDEDVTAKEFEDVTREAIGSFPLSIETADQVAGRVRTILTYGLPNDYYKTYRDEVRKAQLADMKTMSRKFMNDVPVVVVVGRADKTEQQIKDALPDATIVHYDTDLNCIEKDTTFCAANKADLAAAPATAPAPAPAPAK